MKITQALRLPPTPRLAAVGAGGKTSLLFQAGRELLSDDQNTVLLTTTTHLASHQAVLGDRHLVINNEPELLDWSAQIPTGLVVVTGPQGGDQRLAGLGEAALSRLLSIADEQKLPLLVEADGARLKPLKGTGIHEPAIPAFAQQVVVCAGLSALGKPLDAEWVHRPERFAELSGLEPGQAVTAPAIQRVLAHPEGGLKNIPLHARRMLLLTQADTPELQAQGSAIAENLMPYYDRVIISRGEPHNNPDASIYTLEALHVYEETAGILLAAGGASRFGQSKQLLDWAGKPFVRQVAETALQARLSPVIVVVGAFAQEVKEAVAGLPVQIVENPDWQAGQASSISHAVRALPEKAGAAVFLLSDQPQIPAQLIQSLTAMHGQSLAKIIAPLIDERRGNPVLFDRDTFSDLAALSGDQGGRALFARYKVQWLPWHDANLLLDVDTPEDYRRLLAAYGYGAG